MRNETFRVDIIDMLSYNAGYAAGYADGKRMELSMVIMPVCCSVVRGEGTIRLLAKGSYIL